jgi:hypothetical protein
MRSDAKSVQSLYRRNVAVARKRWGSLSSHLSNTLRGYTEQFCLALASGDLTLIDGAWYVTHTGLVGLAKRSRCAGIHVQPVEQFCDASRSRWAFEAKVFKSRSCKGFVGFGDADPSNVSPLVRGAEMRVAETRAVNRALRKAYGIGICSVEELGASSGNRSVRAERKGPCPAEPTNGNNGHHPLRERLCSLIDEHQLDAVLVKRYAADYCGAPELRLATREKVEEFVQHLAESAATDRDSLLAQLNGYAEKQAGAA